jgi:hypothetical protein
MKFNLDSTTTRTSKRINRIMITFVKTKYGNRSIIYLASIPYEILVLNFWTWNPFYGHRDDSSRWLVTTGLEIDRNISGPCRLNQFLIYAYIFYKMIAI